MDNNSLNKTFNEISRLCKKGQSIFDEFYVEDDGVGFAVSICDNFSYIKLENFEASSFNINKEWSTFHMYYENSNHYMTIWASHEDDRATICLLETVRFISNLGPANTQCRKIADEIQNLVSSMIQYRN